MVEIAANTPIRRIEIPGSKIEDELVFFHHDTGKYYATGPVGAEIWEFLASDRTVSEICGHLMARFDIDRPTCEAEVDTFLQELLEAGVIRVGGACGA